MVKNNVTIAGWNPYSQIGLITKGFWFYDLQNTDAFCDDAFCDDAFCTGTITPVPPVVEMSSSYETLYGFNRRRIIVQAINKYNEEVRAKKRNLEILLVILATEI